ncbi:MAG TPA: phage tail protein [Micromonosporaceae bacterium]|nr:phage tail protein [Micromonosporaceae bacterium]
MRKEHIERLLPAAFQRTVTGHGVIDSLLSVMQDLHAPSEATLAHVDDLAAAYRAPDGLLPFLVSWVAWDHIGVSPGVGTDPRAGVPVGRLRDLVANAAVLAAARGTADGMCRLLATVCGVDGFRVDEPVERAFHLVVHIPPPAAEHIDLIRRVVAAEKPAATTCEVVLDEPTADTPQQEKE